MCRFGKPGMMMMMGGGGGGVDINWAWKVLERI